MSDMPESLTTKTPSNVIDGAIPIKKRPAAGKTAESKNDPGTDESQTRRAHRQRMKEFLEAAKSVA